ncbi:putative amidohydrolase YtcJ [Leucobacter exalbidus]|uniref:Amidohydrolase YtcJ n=1 Tax=Leucobacter exalbidus TaxID=662960 RepID=A0A940PSW7_9MICO|nr:amidohydrolase family protein [Leucobacter exalbidus]MBP1326188.1 putative amidohydrolase YtcJ [Leucobacter exalbidus]
MMHSPDSPSTGTPLTPRTGGSLALTGAHLRSNAHLGRACDATALLVIDGRIAHIGSDADITARAVALGIAVRDVASATITPGLFDSHTHPHWAADLTTGIDLGGLATIADLTEALAAEHARLPEGAWLRGWNLDYEAFTGTGSGTGLHYSLIEDAAPGRPIALICYDLHTALGSAAALAAAGITGAREFADASEIVVDDAGIPTGELREPTAYNLLFDAAPAKSHDAERDALRDMLRALAATGLTGGAIMDGKPATSELLAELEERGELDQRLTVHHWHAVGDADDDVARVIAAKDAGGRLWQGGAIKLFSDGVIDTGTAWLHERDAHGDGRAAFWPSWERFAEVVRAYHDAGLLIATHAVGDYAVSQVLDVYAELPCRPGLPAHSIEHLEVLADVDVDRLRAFGGPSSSRVTASMQPLHMQWREADCSDNWAQRLGERAATGYRVRDVIDAGITVTLGSDWPVAQYDPRLGMAWARGRHTPGDASAHVFEPDQQLTGEEALFAYTLWPALARGHADRGVLEVGAVADLTVWGSDPVEATADELPEVPIVLTVVDGRVVHEA